MGQGLEVSPKRQYRRETFEDVATKLGYKDVEEFIGAKRVQRRLEIEKLLGAERDMVEAKRRRKQDLADAEKELKKRLIFKSKYGDRVRAAIRNRTEGKRVVKENSENNLRIAVLKQLIKKLG